jgi:hypothetical protein
MSREYSNLWYQLDSKDAHLIWYTDGRDGIVVDSDGEIPSFRNTDDLLEYVERRNLKVNVEGAILHDLDVLVEWLRQKESDRVDCSDLLAAWNLLTEKIYDKLFWGNNLPSVTPKGKMYIPAWTSEELKITREVLDSGLVLFRGSVRCR